MPRVLFTKANAREMGLKGWASRQEACARRLLEGLPARMPNGPPLDHVTLRLARVRAQLNRIDDMIERARGFQAVDRLSAASERLTKVEFALAGRPMPGSRRPGRDPRGEGMREAVTLDVPSSPAPPSRQVSDVPSAPASSEPVPPKAD
jgi:hypothetical protein